MSSACGASVGYTRIGSTGKNPEGVLDQVEGCVRGKGLGAEVVERLGVAGDLGFGLDEVDAGLVLQVDDVGGAGGERVQDGEGAGRDRGQAGGEGQHLDGDVGAGGGGDDLLELTPADGQVLAVVIGEHPAVQHRLVDHRVQPQGAPLRSG